MDYNPFVFRLVILFTPGVIVSIILEHFTITQEKSSFRFVVSSIVHGILVFFLYYPVSKILKLPFSFFSSINSDIFTINTVELIYVNLLGVAYAIILTIAMNYKVFNKLLFLLRVTNKTGENGVWTHVLNLNPRKSDTQWVNLIDKDDGVMYLGFLQFYSDNLEKENELFLRNVDVYKYQDNQLGDLIYQTPAMYICKPRDKLIVEFPNMKYMYSSKGKITIIKEIFKVFKDIYMVIKSNAIKVFLRLKRSYSVYVGG